MAGDVADKVAAFSKSPRGEMTCLRACGRMRDEMLALAFDRWYRVTLLTLVLDKYADQLMEGDAHRGKHPLSVLAR